jgi:hypothetical protein
MELAVFVGCAVLLALVLILSLGRRQASRARLLADGPLHTEAADAEIEAVDIDQMIEARNERRRLAGRPEIGEELARQALDGPGEP